MIPSMSRIYLVAALCVFVGQSTTTHAFSTQSTFTARHQQQQQPQQHGRVTNSASWNMYMPPAGPTSQSPPVTAQNMLKTLGAEQDRSSNFKLSQSVLASCDTLPSFPTAHGLLSPATVSRMDELISQTGRQNQALNKFLATYRREGPMSCLSMLSDPDVLPHLTEAMREIR